jgi:DNA polymerase-1
VPRYELAGWEADDLIGTISKKCEEEDWECVVVTGDKDALQLVSGATRVLNVKTRAGQSETTSYTPASFKEEYGFEPAKMIDLKALMGDASDNIPGVAGVGEKTALDLVRRFGSVREIYGALESLDIRDSVKSKLAYGREAAKMSYGLATICRDVPIEFTPEETKRRDVDNDALYALFKKLEFSKLTDRLSLKPPSAVEQGPKTFEAACAVRTVVTARDATDMETALRGASWVSVRFNENDGTLAALDESGSICYIIRRSETDGYEDVLRTVMRGDIKKAGHDIKDTERRLLEMGIASDGWTFDTALAAYLLSPTDSSYELPKLAKRYAGVELDAGEDENGQLSMTDDASSLGRLVSEAAAVVLLRKTLELKLHEFGMGALLNDIELPLCAVLADMEKTGFLVDRQALRKFGEMLSGKIAGLESAIYELAGEQFNINSTKQLGAVLFEKLMLPAPKKTKTGYSTNIDVLEYLEDKHPIIHEIMEYRELSKLKSTYTDGLLKVIAPDGRIHTRFQMTVAATGRLSSTDPNLQNIPVRKEVGGELRRMFVAGEGSVLVDADYSQIELRLLAHFAGDAAMLSTFRNGGDIHAATASQVFGVPPEDVTPLMRFRAKAVNFGIVYGISAFSLSRDIGVTVAEAKAYIDSYFTRYSGVRAYMTDIVAQAKRDGFVTTLFGRRRYLPELKSANFNVRSFGERAARNTPMQGTAADIIKLAMVRVHSRLKKEGLKSRLILQVHDELIAECPEGEAEAVMTLLKQEMERVVDISVPMTAEAHMGKSWYDAK